MRIVKDPEIRKIEIIDVAQELFNTVGVENTAISDIVKKVGVAQGTFYYYFKSKDDIIDAIITRCIDESIKKARALVENKEMNALQKVKTIIGFESDKFNGEAGFVDYLHQDKNSGMHEKFFTRFLSDYVPVITEIVEQGISEGIFYTKYPKQVAEFVLIGTHFMLDPTKAGLDKEEYLVRIKAVEDIIEKIVGLKEGSISLDSWVK